MFRYIARRLLFAVPVLFGAMTITFFVSVSVPGDPLAELLGDMATAEQREILEREFQFNRPLHERWFSYITNTVQGNLGTSIRTRNPVTKDLERAVTATLELAIVAFALTAIVGVTLGVIAATQKGRIVDHAITLFTMGGVGAPIFWSALMAQLLFYRYLGWLPGGGRIDDFAVLQDPFPARTGLLLIDSLLSFKFGVFLNAIQHMILPAAILAYRAMGIVVRVTRTSMMEVLQANYMRTGRALGLTEMRLVTRHALKNSLPPILTVLGLALGDLLAGSILVETVFVWPGLGLYAYQSITSLDYPAVIGVALVITIIYIAANLVIDLLYPIVDPRLRSSLR
jgi:peptide/nickel transport system permease protein